MSIEWNGQTLCTTANVDCVRIGHNAVVHFQETKVKEHTKSAIPLLLLTGILARVLVSVLGIDKQVLL